MSTINRKQPVAIEVTQRPLGLTLRRADGTTATASMTRATARQLAAVLANFAGAPAPQKATRADDPA